MFNQSYLKIPKTLKMAQEISTFLINNLFSNDIYQNEHILLPVKEIGFNCVDVPDLFSNFTTLVAKYATWCEKINNNLSNTEQIYAEAINARTLIEKLHNKLFD